MVLVLVLALDGASAGAGARWCASVALPRGAQDFLRVKKISNWDMGFVTFVNSAQVRFIPPSRALDWVLKSTLRVYCPIHLTTPARGVIAGGGRVAQTPCQCMAPPPGFQGQVRVLESCPNRRSLWRGGMARVRGPPRPCS